MSTDAAAVVPTQSAHSLLDYKAGPVNRPLFEASRGKPPLYWLFARLF